MGEDLVSVLLPVHRDNPFLESAIKSILDQDYPYLEILFLDNSREGLDVKAWLKFRNFRYIKVPGEFGLSETLNVGILESTGVFLLRMDYDDVCMPTRVSQQVKFMQDSPEIGISGTFAKVIGSSIDSNVKPGEIISRPSNPDLIDEYLLYKNPLIHPTVIMRKSLILKYRLTYNKKFNSAEDLDLWTRASKYFPIGNIPKPLLHYRIHASQYSRLDGINSRLQSAIIRSRHSARIIFTTRALRNKASRVLVKNFILIVKLRFLKILSGQFKKFG
jgi:glycosyltransferase involved in cell wall biosynthesis